jgi:hypothetical protein
MGPREGGWKFSDKAAAGGGPEKILKNIWHLNRVDAKIDI